jgi:ACS family hexuronate transporter-like MFS transporter
MVVPVLAVSFTQNLWIATLVIGLAAAGHQGWSANLYTLVSDTMPRHSVSSVTGMGGMVGALAAVFIDKLVGFLLQTTHNSYFLIFLIIPIAYLLGFLVIHLLLPTIEPAVE